jgi:hypothetical protein
MRCADSDFGPEPPPPCPALAERVTWCDAPGFDTPTPRCERHATHFERLAARHLRGKALHSLTLDEYRQYRANLPLFNG